MRILLVQDTDWIERGPHQQHHLMEMLSLRGHEVRVIDFEFTWKSNNENKEIISPKKIFNDLGKYYTGAKVTVVRPPFVRIPFLDYASMGVTHRREIRSQIKEFNPDVILGFGILGTYFASEIAKKHNIPFIYYWIDVLHTLIPTKAFQSLGRLLEKQAIKNSDRIITINDRLSEYVSELVPSFSEINLIRAGIDLNRFRESGSREELRQKLGFNKDDIVLFFMGWMYEFSGLKEVAKELGNVDKRLKLLIVGEGDAYEDLVKIQEQQGLEHRIKLTGKRPYEEIPGLIESSDICMLPAYPWEKIMQDIVPIKLYEYLALGKPVLVTKLPGVIREFGEESGLVYVDCPEDTVTKALEVYGNRQLYENLSKRAKTWVSQYTWDNLVSEFEEILKKVLSKKVSA